MKMRKRQTAEEIAIQQTKWIIIAYAIAMILAAADISTKL